MKSLWFRTSVIWNKTFTSASFCGVELFPGIARNLADPIALAVLPLVGDPTVSRREVCTGGVHDGTSSGAAWARLGLMH